jgi:DNA-binding SARP family transcriptional activator/Tfp pilus assembly protein PilF
LLESAVEFQVLGTVDVFGAGQRIDAGRPKQRAVLAVLVLDLNQVVPAGRLIDRIWGEDPPSSVRNVLYGYVARLRSVLAAAADPAVSLSRRAGGYVLEAGDDQVDLFRFRALVSEANISGDEQAAVLLRESLDQWHGEALAGLSGPWFAAMRASLARQKMAALLDLNDIRLRQGQHHALAPELAGQAAAHPADERLAGQLMRALYVSGRQAEALRWFEQTRQRLADELGADPGPELLTLHQQILRADTSLSLPGPAVPAGPVPRQLPPQVSAFTGRAAELAELDQLLAGPETGHSSSGSDGPARAVVISAVSGTAGVGKTATALRWAHHAAGLFPDGQLYVNLRGYDPGEPLTPADALAGFLRGLGVASCDIPAEADERAARYRSLLAGRRVLVVLDNADSMEQVRPLLPGSPGCAVLVTSRDSLAGLIARDGAQRLELGLLPLADAVSLLRALIGGRVEADPAAAIALAQHCCRLPLALRVAAELAAGRPADSLAALASELADRQRRLDLLDAGGDPTTAVRAVFSWSCRHLDPDAARAFRLVCLHPGPDLDSYAAAALMGSSLQRASRALDQLARAYLVHPTGPGRYSMHDLLRGYARELAAAHGDADERPTALTRLFDHYLHTASAAMDSVFPAEQHRRPRIPAPAAPAPAVIDPAAARTWLDAELANLIAIAVHAADHGWPSHVTRLAATLFRYLDAGGRFPEAITIHSHARRAARDTGDRAAEATALTNLSAIDAHQGRYQQAASHLRPALALFREAGDRAGAARTLGNLGIVDFQQGRYEQATGDFQQSLVLFRETGDKTGEARALHYLGALDLQKGRYQQAASHLQLALSLYREAGDRSAEAHVMATLGDLDLRQGRYQQAAERARQALALFRDTGNRFGEAYGLGILGSADLRQDRFQQAAGHHQRALALSREIGDRSGEASALNRIGEAFVATSQPDRARSQHASALALASKIGDKYQQARAHHGLARAHNAGSEPEQARDHWQRALTLYTYLGVPEADQVRAELTAADNHGYRRP